MNNGTTVHLRLYENGYVRFQGLPDVCAQIPKNSFDPLIEVMKNHTGSEPAAVADPTGAKFGFHVRTMKSQKQKHPDVQALALN